jgi:SAM-dependent methyltransferase
MGEITSGLRSIVSIPVVYSTFQKVLGAGKVRADFTEKFIRPFAGCTILDIGCGPADLLDYLNDADYWGFDISEAYIIQAKKKYGNKGKFFCRELTPFDVSNMPPFDIVLASGLLHHLDDEEAVNVMRLAYKALKPEGRLVTLDPCLEPEQNPVARFLVKNDRGQNIRNKAEYSSLASTIFKAPRVEIYHKSGIPYTHCFMECIRS